MSRIGKKPVPIPANVQVTVDGSTVKVKGPKGELAREIRPEIAIRVEDGEIVLERSSEEKQHRA